MTEHSRTVDRVQFGLATIPEDQRVSVKLRDLMFIHQVLGELVKFLHQPMHYPTLEDVNEFLGSHGSGDAFDVLSEAYYNRIRDMMPPEIHEAFDEGRRFEHPLPPNYFKPREGDA